MNNKVREEKCIMCKTGTVEFFKFEICGEEVISGACDCGYCCGNEQELGKLKND